MGKLEDSSSTPFFFLWWWGSRSFRFTGRIHFYLGLILASACMFYLFLLTRFVADGLVLSLKQCFHA